MSTRTARSAASGRIGVRHHFVGAADGADGEATTHHLSHGGEVGEHAEELLRTAAGQAQGDQLIEDEEDPCRSHRVRMKGRKPGAGGM